MFKQLFKQIRANKINILSTRVVNYNRFIQSTSIHISIKKIQHFNNENLYAFNVLNKESIRYPVKNTQEVSNVDEFNKIMNQNYRNNNISEIVNTFLIVKNFCISNNVAVSDYRFDNLIDGLIDNCEYISDEELINLLYTLSEYPLTDSYMAHNFHDLWSCLDDICCWKMVDWDISKCYNVANAWYLLQLGKLCDYIFILIDRFVKKADKLSKNELVHMYFYLNICRRRAVDFEYEFALEKLIDSMDIDEIAIVAMGYFKTKTKIKLVSIQEAMVLKVSNNTSNIHEISLTAILKALRYSKTLKIYPMVQNMTDKLYPEIDRLSYTSCTHLALLSTGIQIYNENIFQKVSKKFIKEISNKDLVRIKDIERMLNALTMFNYDPKTNPDIFEASLNELYKREDELKSFPRCLICMLNYLSLRDIYSYEFLNRILDIEYIQRNFGKGSRNVPREVFSLDVCIDVECKDYAGNRLPKERRYKTVKWFLEYTPTHDQYRKITAADKLVLDTIDAVKLLLGDEKLMYINHVLPHFSRADIILCKDKVSNKFIEPKGFDNYLLGDVMYPMHNDSLEWFSIVVNGWNNTVKETGLLLGHAAMKERQLKKIGYKPVRILWNEFSKLTKDMRRDYILNKLE